MLNFTQDIALHSLRRIKEEEEEALRLKMLQEEELAQRLREQAEAAARQAAQEADRLRLLEEQLTLQTRMWTWLLVLMIAEH